jgi:peptidyl-prolyl cis-trans isomerase D
MLNSLRKSAGSWVVRIFLGLLILSFALWGIEGIFLGRANQNLAEVGSREITAEAFQRNYRNQLNLVSNQLGRQITNQEARSFGIAQSVLQNMISTTAIDIHADSLGLGISDEAIVSAIHSEPAFKGAGDKFDPQRFEEILRNVGMSEQGFIALQREEMVREQIASALSRNAFVPKTLLDAMNHYRNDERVLKYFVVKPEVAGQIPQPDETTLKSYYEDNKTSYMAPEYRKIGLLSLTPEAIKDTIALTDDELKAHFEATKAQYVTPERRTIQQLTFNTMEAAQSAAEKLAKGEDFMETGKSLGMTESDINLGTFAKEGLADKKVADAAFSLAKGEVSKPIDSFFPVIVKVTEITPGEEKTFDQVKDQVRAALAQEKARNEIQKLYDSIEDERAGGANVTETAKKLNLPYKEIALDRSGRGQDGKAVNALPGGRAAINLVFESDVGVENNPVTAGDGYAFIDVLEVIPERQKSFEEVKEDVKTAWIAEETRKRVRAKADELVEKAKSGTDMETLAKEIGASASTTAPLKRDATPQGLPRTAISLVFTLPENGAGNVQMSGNEGQAVFQVAEIKKAPPLDDSQAEALRAELRQGIGVDILTQYVGALQKDYGVQLNNQAISAVLGQ